MSLSLLAAALLLARYGASHPFSRAGALFLAALAGLGLPDLDFSLPFGHRSALTHSILPALLVAAWMWARPIAAGLAIGIGLHLSADTFPDEMVGFATVKLPFSGSVGAAGSYAWLAINAALCVWLGARGLRQSVGHEGTRRVVAAALVATGFAYLLTVDGGWVALLAYTGLGWIGYRLTGVGGKRLPIGVSS